MFKFSAASLSEVKISSSGVMVLIGQKLAMTNNIFNIPITIKDIDTGILLSTFSVSLTLSNKSSSHFIEVFDEFVSKIVIISFCSLTPLALCSSSLKINVWKLSKYTILKLLQANHMNIQRASYSCSRCVN